MQLPWLTRPPTAKEVAAHAKAYPCQGFEFTWGCWLQLDPTVEPCSLPRLRFLRVAKNGTITADNHGTPAIWKSDQKSRWLPYTAEGIPVCLLSVMAAASVEKALEHLTEALAVSVDWENEIPITRNEIRKARDLLLAVRNL